MFLEYDWTFGVFRPRFGTTFIAVLGERSWPTMADAKAALNVAGMRVGRKTDSRTWAIESTGGEK